MFNIKVDYPTFDEEKRILGLTTRKDEAVELTKVLSGKAILNLQKLVRSVPVGDYVARLHRRGWCARRGRKDPTAPDFVKQDGRLGGRAARRPVPAPRRQGAGGDGRPLQRGHRRHQEGGHPGAAAPHQHQLPGPGRGQEPARTSSSNCWPSSANGDVGKYEKRKR